MSSFSETKTHLSLYNEIDEGTESLYQYHSGGLPVVQIGDELKRGQYQIVHKLGHGGTSTVWLALSQATSELVTIKALSGTASVQSCEADFLSRFSSHEGVRKLLDVFDEAGPNGQHRYLVLEPALCSVFTAKETSCFRPLPLLIARALIADLVLTIQHLHANGVVHGDIHTGNTLLRFSSDMRKMSISELYQRIGPPETEGIQRRDGAPLSPNIPREVAWPARLELNATDICPSHHLPAMLSDFGSSFEPAITRRDYARTLPALAPPESLFAEADSSSISFPADIWTLGCTIVEIMGKGAPFGTLADPNDIISEQIMVLGKLPERWWAKWNARSQYFSDDCTTYLPLNQRVDDSVEKRYDWCVTQPRSRYKEEAPGNEEKRALVQMLKTMLVYEPSERATIDEITDCDWMQRWGIPSKETS